MCTRNEEEMCNPMTLEKFVSYLAFRINFCNELREKYPEDYGKYYEGKEDAYRSMWVLAKSIRKLKNDNQRAAGGNLFASKGGEG